MRGRAQPRQPTRQSMLDGASVRAPRLVMVLNLVLECLAGAVAASPVHQLGERRPPLPLTWPHPHPRKPSVLSPTTPADIRPDDRSHGGALSPETTTSPAAARSPCAQPLAHHLVPLPSPPPLPCAHSLAHHPYLAHTLLLTTPTLRALPCSPPLPMHDTQLPSTPPARKTRHATLGTSLSAPPALGSRPPCLRTELHTPH